MDRELRDMVINQEKEKEHQKRLEEECEIYGHIDHDVKPNEFTCERCKLKVKKEDGNSRTES